jgi:hypothetical protein
MNKNSYLFCFLFILISKPNEIYTFYILSSLRAKRSNLKCILFTSKEIASDYRPRNDGLIHSKNSYH